MRTEKSSNVVIPSERQRVEGSTHAGNRNREDPSTRLRLGRDDREVWCLALVGMTEGRVPRSLST